MTCIKALIHTLEGASGGSRELDEEIARELGWTEMPPWTLKERHWIDLGDNESAVPHYTTSLDTALTLVPEGMLTLSLEMLWDTLIPRGHPAVSIRWAPEGRLDNGKNWKSRLASAPTPALALCIAALKARSATE